MAIEGIRMVYPDPFQPASAELKLEEPSVVSAVVVDDRGEDIATLLVNANLSSGLHSIPLPLPHGAGGALYLRVSILQQGRENVALRRIR